MGIGSYTVAFVVLCLVSVIVHWEENQSVNRGNDRNYWMYVIAIPVFTSIFAGSVLMFALLFLIDEGRITDGDTSGCQQQPQSHKIVSVNRGSEVAGRFFLGTGNIGSRSYYYTYIEENRGFKLYKFKTDDTHIVETNDSPTITYDNYSCPMPTYDFVFGGKHVRNHKQWNQVLHVPYNTILREFKL